jgi:5-methylcytosine-specific restriction endonuclease McrA
MKAPCKHPGCPALVNGNAYCEKHAQPPGEAMQQARRRYDATTRKNDPQLAAAAEFRSSRKWQRVRRMKLSMNPLCEDPLGHHARRGITETAKEAHHIVPLAECAHDPRAYDLANLMSVCWSCHNKIEAAARRTAPPGGVK